MAAQPDRFESARIDHLRVPPHSNDAERAVLGGLMLDERALPKIADFLTEEDFYAKTHRLIFRGIKELAEKNLPCDAVTLGEWFESNGLAELVGGTGYVLQLANSTPSAANITAYAEIVREHSRRRTLIDVGTRLAGAAFEPQADASALASLATSEIAALGAESRGGLKPIKSSVGAWFARLHERFERREEYSGLLTPWAKVNDLTLGLQGGDLVIVAGRSNMGKSVFGFQLPVFAALNGKRCAVHSLEMRDEAFVQRAVAAHGKIAHRSLRRPKDVQEDEWPRIVAAMTVIAAAPLHIDDQAGLTAAQIVARAKRQHHRGPLSLIVVDHLHAIRRIGRDPVNEIADAAQQLKNLAKELNIPVVLLCQMNRGAHARADHRPTMADLRGSGAIEEIGDVIFFLHREDYYDKSTHMKGVVELIVGKGRDMPTGDTIYLENRFDQMRLDDWEGPLPEPPKAEKKARRGFSPDADPRVPD